MKKFINKICLIIATRDRTVELFRLLQSLDGQTYQPDSIIIVDAGKESDEGLVSKVPGLQINYARSAIASAAKQRNTGLGMVSAEITLVGFLDDDIILEPDALEMMMEFWENADNQVGGAAFNMVNCPTLLFSGMKSHSLTKKLGLYSEEEGRVLSSGFHTMIGQALRVTQVQWLSSGAAIWRRDIFNEFKFDEWFSGYSYLEDLDFGYNVSKRYKLFVLPEPKFYHYPSKKGRDNGYIFGKKEILNRVYFVKKNKELSLVRCYLSLCIRMFISLIGFFSSGEKYYIQRILGNIVGIVKSASIIFKTSKK